MQCPLCGDKALITLQEFDIVPIKEYYLSTGYDVEYLFAGNNTLLYKTCQNCTLSFFLPVILGDKNYYAYLQREEWYFMHDDKNEYDFSAKFVKATDHVLDIGCGRGRFASYIKCEAFHGLEFSEKAIELAKKDGISVNSEFIEEHCLTHKEKYDIVVSFQVLEHVFEIKSFISSALKCLKNEGYFIITVPNNDSFIKETNNFFLNLPPHHELHWNEKALRKIAELYNLEIVEIYKEKVAGVHEDWFYDVLKNSIGRRIKNVETPPILLSQKNPLRGLSKKIISLYCSFLRKIKFHQNKDGQSITIVYKKIS